MFASLVRVCYTSKANRAIEQKFIRLALSDSEDLQVDHFPLLQNTRSRWPVNELANYLTDDTYDCIILGDVDSEALGFDVVQAIVNRVSRGAGLIVLGGYHSLGPGATIPQLSHRFFLSVSEAFNDSRSGSRSKAYIIPVH